MPVEAKSIQHMIKLLSDPEKPGITKHLKPIYICGAVHVYIRGYRKYNTCIEYLLTFFCLKSLEVLITLSASLFNSFSQRNDKFIEGEPLRSSNLSELAFDVAMLNIDDIVSFLRIPKALKRFCKSQNHLGFGIASCHLPAFRELGGGRATGKQRHV